MGYKLIIFDLDRIIFDTKNRNKEALEISLNAFNCKIDEEVLNEISTCSKARLRDILHKKYDDSISVDALLYSKDLVFNRIIEEDGVALNKGAFYMLNHLKELDCSVVASTCLNEKSIEEYIRDREIDKYLDVLVVNDDLEHYSSTEDIVSAIIDKFEVNEEETLLLASNVYELEDIEDYNIKTILISSNKSVDEETVKVRYANKDIKVVSNLEELLKIL